MSSRGAAKLDKPRRRSFKNSGLSCSRFISSPPEDLELNNALALPVPRKVSRGSAVTQTSRLVFGALAKSEQAGNTHLLGISVAPPARTSEGVDMHAKPQDRRVVGCSNRFRSSRALTAQGVAPPILFHLLSSCFRFTMSMPSVSMCAPLRGASLSVFLSAPPSLLPLLYFE